MAAAAPEPEPAAQVRRAAAWPQAAPEPEPAEQERRAAAWPQAAPEPEPAEREPAGGGVAAGGGENGGGVGAGNGVGPPAAGYAERPRGASWPSCVAPTSR